MKKLLIVLFTLLSSLSHAQDKINYTSEELSINKHIDGTLLLPKDVKKPNLAIIIAGSGPTDRDGNQNFLKNNSLKKLAINLSNNNIATYRYDKRIVKQLKSNTLDKDIMFDHFVDDAKSVLDFFKKSNNYNKIYIIGHSQGSLVGMLAAKENADGFISLAGAGQPIDQVIKRVFGILKSGKTTTDYPIALASIFNIEIQKFMINWMSYNPTEILKILKIPILIVNGTKDLQVSEAEANLLKAANSKASIEIIDNMNHVLVDIEGDDLENSKSYAETQRPLSPKLIHILVEFINK